MMIFRQEYLVPYDHLSILVSQINDSQDNMFIEPLSGLYTRMGVEYKIRSILAIYRHNDTPERVLKHCVVILISLDFNTQGHAGDVIGKILKQCFREVDVCGRLGDDEFIVIMQDMHLRSAKSHQKIKALQKRLSTIGISASIGVTQFSEPITHNERLFWKKAKRTVNRAEQAMRVGKIFGKNRVVYYY